MRTHKAQTGEALSFTAFLAACVARAVDEHKAVQAYRQGGNRLVLFHDVDISTWIEHDIGGRKYIIPYVLRAANRKTVRELHEEIRAAQRGDVAHSLQRFRPLSMPTILYRPFIWALAWMGSRRPRLWKASMGTVGISAVGMFGDGAGWGIPIPTPTALMVTIGGIGEQQMRTEGHDGVRELLSLTLSFDHDVVDGAPAARFTRRLKELVESGYGLDGVTVMSQRDGVADTSPQPVGASRTVLR